MSSALNGGENLLTSFNAIRMEYRSGTTRHITAYDMMYTLLHDNKFVSFGSSRHRQKLDPRLLKFMDPYLKERKIEFTAEQAKTPYTALVKLVCYDTDQDVDNPIEKTRIANTSLILQASFFWEMTPSEAIRYGGGGTEGAMIRRYREERNKRKPKKKAVTPDEIVKDATTDVVGRATLERAWMAKIQAGTNVAFLPESPVIILATRSGETLHIHGWTDAIDHYRFSKRIAEGMA